MYTPLYNGLHKLAAICGFGLASYGQPHRLQTISRVRRFSSTTGKLMTPLECGQLFACVLATAKLGGEMAEVGVYRGRSAKIIREADKARPLHLFDTFSGLPSVRSDDVEQFRAFKEGEFAADAREVRNYLKDEPNLAFHVGMFPSTATPIEHARFSFVHSDVDIYESSKAVCEFFYPRLVPGGIFLSHDFVSCQGPHRAVAEFFADKPEPVIELPGDQALIVKL